MIRYIVALLALALGVVLVMVGANFLVGFARCAGAPGYVAPLLVALLVASGGMMSGAIADILLGDR